MELYAAVVNTYSCIGDEFHNFCAAVHGDNRGKGRGKSLRRLLSLLAVYANAEIVLLLHAPSKTRAQREDVMVATAAKDAAVPAAPPARGTRVSSLVGANWEAVCLPLEHRRQEQRGGTAEISHGTIRARRRGCTATAHIHSGGLNA